MQGRPPQNGFSKLRQYVLIVYQFQLFRKVNSFDIRSSVLALIVEVFQHCKSLLALFSVSGSFTLTNKVIDLFWMINNWRYLRNKLTQEMTYFPTNYTCIHLTVLTVSGKRATCGHLRKAERQDKQRKLQFKIMDVFCLSCPSATFAHQHGGFVPREWLPAKGL